MSDPIARTATGDVASSEGEAAAVPEQQQPHTARRLLVLAAAFAMMLGVRALQVEVSAGVADPLTLAACGFVLLTAFTVGELGASLGLPKVSGYILAGALVGPQVADVLSNHVVSDLTVFNTLALGLIAVSAGLELDLTAIRRVAVTLATTVLGKLALLPVLVGLPLFLEERYVGLLGMDTLAEQLSLALTFSVLGIGTSPAIALAIVNDTGAKGRLVDLLLAMAVVKDVVVVTCLAIAVAASEALLGGGAIRADVLVEVIEEIGASVAAGSVVGALFIGYFRWFGVEPLFSALIAILLVAEASHVLHLELLLVFIVAGFVVANFSRYGHDLLEPIERISLPVFVVFFTTAGARIDLRGTLAILPLAGVLVAMRWLAYYLAGRVGGWAGGEKPAVANNAWMAYLPQAGVTLGLVLLASEQIPELGETIRQLGMALVALNLLTGPITLTYALNRSGEVRKREAAARPEQAPGTPSGAPSTGDAAGSGPITASDPTRPGFPLFAPILDSLASTELRQRVEETRAAVESAVARFVAEAIRPHADQLEHRAHALAPASDTAGELHRVRRVLVEPHWTRGELDARAAALFDDVSRHLRELPWECEVPLDPAAMGEGIGGWGAALRRRSTAARALFARLRRVVPQRLVPVQLSLRLAFEPRLSEALVEVTASFYRAEGEILSSAGSMARRSRAADPEVLSRLARGWELHAEHVLSAAVHGALVHAVATLRIAGGPALPASAIRFADAEAAVGLAIHQLAHDGEPWQQRIAAAEDTLRLALLVESFAERTGRSVELRAIEPVRACREALIPLVAQLADRLEQVAQRVGEGDQAGVAAVAAATDQVLSHGLAASIRRRRAQFQRDSQLGPLVADLAEIVKTAPERLAVVARQTPVGRARRPEAVTVRDVAFAAFVQSVLRDELLAATTAALVPVSELVAAVDERAREAISVARYGAELAARGGFDDPAERRAVVTDAVARGVRRLKQLGEALDTLPHDAEAALAAAMAAATDQLRGLSIEDGRGATGRTVRSSLRGLTEAVRRGWRRLVIRADVLRQKVGSLADQQTLRDLKIRNGHERLDAAGIREYLDTFCRPPEARGVPTVYVRLMAAVPVTERRLFVARGPALAEVLAAMAPEDALGDYVGGPAPVPSRPPTTIVVGAAGAGRSSLLNMVKMQLVGPRVLWLDPAFAERSDGPLRALATELSVTPDLETIAEALKHEPTAVLIDDLHGWIEPSPRGLGDLEALLDAMDLSTPSTRWLVSMEAEAFGLLDDVLGLGRRFRRVLNLGPLDWSELANIFDQREQLGGFDTDFRARGLAGRISDLVRPGRPKETYFRALSRASLGNPATASAIHLHAIQPDGDTLRAGSPVAPHLPFLDQVGDECLAILAALARFGALDPTALSGLSGLSEAEAASRLGYLLHAGLVEERSRGIRRVALVPALVPAIRRELGDMGILGGVV